MKLIFEFVNVENVEELYSCMSNLREDLQKLDPSLAAVEFKLSQEENMCVCEIVLGMEEKEFIITKEARNINSVFCQAKSQSRKVIRKNRKERLQLKLKRNKLLIDSYAPVHHSRTSIRSFDFSAN